MSITLVSFGIVLILLLTVIEAVRRGALETKYSLLWIFMCVSMAILSLSEGFINQLGEWMGVFYPPSLLFLFGLLFAFLLIFDLTRRVSKLNKELTHLAQEYAILRKQLEEKERQSS
jgi:hypothetical protein